jgi:hypothetical protein
MDTELPFGIGLVIDEFCDGGAQGVVQSIAASNPGEAVFAFPLSEKTKVKHPLGLLIVAVT